MIKFAKEYIRTKEAKFTIVVTVFAAIFSNLVLSLSNNIKRQLESYKWPGNSRQISNYMERIVILNQNKNIYKNFELLDLIDDMGDLDNTGYSYNQNFELNL